MTDPLKKPEGLSWNSASVELPEIPMLPAGQDALSATISAVLPTLAAPLAVNVATLQAKETMFSGKLGAAQAAYQNSDDAGSQSVGQIVGMLGQVGQQAGQLLPGLRTEIEREFERLSLVARQIRTLEAQQKQQVRSGAQPVIALLARLTGIGTGSAWTLVKELFGWRQFHNRREVAGCLGLAPTPYSSGTSEVEQGISKAGNKRARWLMVELAWSWLRFQPASQLSCWFNERFAGAGKRLRRIGIVALARRLAIALWRYLEFGEIPVLSRYQWSRKRSHRT